MPAPPSPKRVSRVYVLVHPFYSFWPVPRLNVGDYRRVFKHLSGVWGEKIRQASEDSEGLLIIVKDADPDAVRVVELGKKSSSTFWFMKQILRLFSFARKKMSSRIIEVNGRINPELLRHELFSRGMIYSRRSLRVRGFGEWLDYCVDAQTKLVARALRVRSGRVKLISRASVSIFPHSSKRRMSNQSIGNYARENVLLGRHPPFVKRKVVARGK